MQATIPHVVGTVTMITIFVLVGTYGQHIYLYTHTEAAAFELRQIANQVSSSIVDLVSLCHMSSVDQNLTKNLDLPSGVYDELYTLQVYTSSDPVTDEHIFVVRAHLSSKPSAYGVSELPWTAGSASKVEVNDFSSSGVSGLSVHCQKTGNNVTVNLTEW